MTATKRAPCSSCLVALLPQISNLHAKEQTTITPPRGLPFMCQHPSLSTSIAIGSSNRLGVATLIGKIETAIGYIAVDNSAAMEQTDNPSHNDGSNQSTSTGSLTSLASHNGEDRGKDAVQEARTVSNTTLQSLASSMSKKKRMMHSSEYGQRDESPLRKRTCRRISDDESPVGSPHSNKHHYVVEHHYHDYSIVPPSPGMDSISPLLETRKGSGGNGAPFPKILHDLLERAELDGYSDCISWQPHGRSFKVHDQERFVNEVMPAYFRQTRFSSFQRQLSLYGFLRTTRKGPDRGAYYHELFLRGMPDLVATIQRTRIKGCWVRQSSSPDTEPDFYAMPAVGDFEPIPIVSCFETPFPSGASNMDYDGSIKLATLGTISPSIETSGRTVYPPLVPLFVWDDIDSIGEVAQSLDPLQITEVLRENEQQELAEFLVDVDLVESSNLKNDEADKGEDELFRIYSMINVPPRFEVR